MKRLISFVCIALGVTSGALAAPGTPADVARALLQNAQRTVAAHAPDIDARSALTSQAMQARLHAHLTRLDAATTDDLLLLAQLDASLAEQLANDRTSSLSQITGAAAVLLPNVADGMSYPVAVYVPAAYAGGRPAPLIIYLHGKGESEADVVASTFVRSLAADTEAVVVAPYMRGDDMLSEKSIADVYRVLDAAENSLNIDRRRVFLAGQSLGGFAAFKALARHADSWTALLVVQGAVAETDSSAVAAHVRGKPIYLVAGANDPSIKSSYMRQLAGWLRQNGALAMYYEQPDGVHSLMSVAPALGKAWRDMLAGVRPSATTEDLVAPTPQPTKRP